MADRIVYISKNIQIHDEWTHLFTYIGTRMQNIFAFNLFIKKFTWNGVVLYKK